MKTYKVKYSALGFEGVMDVEAQDENQAIEMVKKWVAKRLAQPPGYVISCEVVES